jgi:hypothetical protein
MPNHVHFSNPFEELCWKDLVARGWEVLPDDKEIRRQLRQRSSQPYPDADPSCDFLARHRFAQRQYLLAEAKEGEDFDHALLQLGTAGKHFRSLISPLGTLTYVVYVEAELATIRGYQLRSVAVNKGWNAGTHRILQSVAAGGPGAGPEVTPARPRFEMLSQGLKRFEYIADAEVEVNFRSNLRHPQPALLTYAQGRTAVEICAYIFGR